jgi:hypothetical protein
MKKCKHLKINKQKLWFILGLKKIDTPYKIEHHFSYLP